MITDLLDNPDPYPPRMEIYAEYMSDFNHVLEWNARCWDQDGPTQREFLDRCDLMLMDKDTGKWIIPDDAEFRLADPEDKQSMETL